MLAVGSVLAVVGRSGRSEYLRSLGRVWEPGGLGKTRPQELGRRGDTGRASALAAGLSAAGLWTMRAQPFAALGEEDRAAGEIVAGLLGGVTLFDGLFDGLDPWRAAELWAYARGATACAVTTHRLDLVGEEDRVAVVRRGEAVFVGTPAELRARGPLSRFEVTTGRGGAVAAMMDPLAVDVRVAGETLTLAAREGQEAAVRLLLQGYGDVRSFVVREPTLAEAIGALL